MSSYSAGAAFRQAVKDESPLQVVGAINANHDLLDVGHLFQDAQDAVQGRGSHFLDMTRQHQRHRRLQRKIFQVRLQFLQSHRAQPVQRRYRPRLKEVRHAYSFSTVITPLRKPPWSPPLQVPA